MKRLVLQAIETAFAGGVTFWIAEQTHRGREFGNGSCMFVSSDGYSLTSSITPQVLVDGTCVLGSDRSVDRRAFNVSDATFARIKQAVAEYNAAFADKPQAASASMPPILTIE